MKSKSRILLISTIIIFILTIFIGTSYSLWQTINTQDSVNTATTKCFNVEITSQKNSISLENAYPITNEKGKKLTPFSFTITNTCDIFASYTVSLESLKDSTLSSKFLNAMINNEEIKKLSDYESTDTVNDGSIESHILAKGSLGSGDSEDYTLRVWIDYDTTMEDLNNETKTLKSKIVIKAEPSSWSPVDEGYTTLHDAILANEYQSSPEIAIKKIESKGVPNLNQQSPSIKWQEKSNNTISTVSVIKPAPSTIKCDEVTSSLENNSYLMSIFTEKKVSNSKSVIKLSNEKIIDPTTIDFKNNEKYYFASEFIYYHLSDNKLYSTFSNDGSTIYEIQSATKENIKKTWNNKEYDAIKYNLKVKEISLIESEEDTSEKGLYGSTDDFGSTYYYRGNVNNNNVYFAGFYWKIIRINGDGSIRIIYNGDEKNSSTKSIDTSVYNDYPNSPAYVGYMYGSKIDTGDNCIKNEVSSSVKEKLDNWYKNNLLNFNNYINDSGFCNDRTINSGDGYSADKNTYYQGYYRFGTDKAVLYCPDADNDLFTTKFLNHGNKALTYPIGLITSDELTYAGAASGNANKKFYLYDYSYRTMTPSIYGSISQVADTLAFYSDGIVHSYGVATSLNIKPVISLKSDVEISGGIGTINEPFVVKTE